MSKRANVRREKKYKAKLNTLKETPDVKAQKITYQAVIDGREYAACMVIRVLYKVFGWREKRIKNYLDHCAEECAKLDRAGVSYVLAKYDKMVGKALDEVDIDMFHGKDIFKNIYIVRMKVAVVDVVALQLVVLNDHYSMSNNSKQSGRLDSVLAYCQQEWIKIQGENMSPAIYRKETSKLIGFDL